MLSICLGKPKGPQLSLKNPILTASGTFGSGLEFAPYGDLAKLGGIVVKGLSLEPRAGNPMPRVVETACGMLNAVGLQNDGVNAFLKDTLPRLPWRDVPIIVNLHGASTHDFAALAGILGAETAIAGLEVNISCPNVSEGGLSFGQDARMAKEVVKAVKEAAPGKFIIAKLTPNVTDIASIALAVEAAGADAISCINTLSGMAVDIRTRKPMLANIVGGLSGPAIKPVALRCVWQVARAVSIPVFGIGGIMQAEDVLEFILVGASAVQIGTANFIRPDISFRMADEVAALCAQLGIDSLESLRGALLVPA
jgi:dihydroorotate dehydrogenase (NAD+) catalytic subunit